MKRFVALLICLLLALPFGLVGCGKPSKGEMNNSPIGGGSTDSSGETSGVVQASEFRVTLQPPQGSTVSPEALIEEGIQVIWTEKNGNGAYKAPFDEKGVAVYPEADGEYQVTLSKAPTGYTYDPNVYLVDNDHKGANIALYPLRGIMGGNGSDCHENVMQLTSIGAYRFTFESPSVFYFFKFNAAFEGKISFASLMDITANEVRPAFNKVTASNGYVGERIIGGGPENTYTVNFYTVYNLSDSQELCFRIGVESNVPEEKVFPVTLDILVEKSEYEDESYGLELVPAPVDLPVMNKNTVASLFPQAKWLYNPSAKTNGKTYKFVSIAEMGGAYPKMNKVFDEKMVIYDEETKYYYVDLSKANGGEPRPDKTRPLVAILTRDLAGIIEYTTPGGDKPNEGISYRAKHSCYCRDAGKDYTQFVKPYFANVNKDGAYPVDKNLKQFLFDYSVSNRIFYDGYGGLADSNYSTDAASRWMFLCGYYEAV